MRFHLPAFLIQGLLEEIDPPILTFTNPSLNSRFSLLSPEQLTIVRDYLRFMADDPDCPWKEDIHAALDGYWAE